MQASAQCFWTDFFRQVCHGLSLWFSYFLVYSKVLSSYVMLPSFVHLPALFSPQLWSVVNHPLCQFALIQLNKRDTQAGYVKRCLFLITTAADHSWISCRDIR